MKTDIYVSTPFPVLTQLSIKSLMAHFDDDVYDKTPSSHIRHIVEALCGYAGIGELLSQSVKMWLNGGVDTAWFCFLDRLFETIYGLPRIYEEKTAFSPSDSLLTIDEVKEAFIKEAMYKNRFICIMKALQAGGTVKGFRFACMAVCYCDCDIYETWRYKKKSFAIGRLGHTLYNETIVAPYNSSISERQKDLLLRILDRIKPAETVVTVDQFISSESNPVNARSSSASSSYFEVIEDVTNNNDNGNINKQSLFIEPVYGETAFLDAGKKDTVETRLPIEHRTQERISSYIYDSSKETQIIDAKYSSIKNGKESVEDNFNEDEDDSSWTNWFDFDIADCPENYPGGKNGVTPHSSPAINIDGSPYVFQFASQAEYEEKQAEYVIKNGGQVSGHRYRYRYSHNSHSTTYVPESAICSIPSQTSHIVIPDNNQETKTTQIDRIEIGR